MREPRIQFTRDELRVVIACLEHALAGEASGGPLAPGLEYGDEDTKRWEKRADRLFVLAGRASAKAKELYRRRGGYERDNKRKEARHAGA